VHQRHHHAFVFGHRLAASFLNAMLNDELVDFGHGGTVPSHWSRRNVGVWWQELLGRYLILSY
jgi:hypothetical protein